PPVPLSPRLTLFPYTTLFRSFSFHPVDGAGEIRGGAGRRRGRGPVCRRAPPFPVLQGKLAPSPKEVFRSGQRRSPFDDACALGRSEEHTSELQSRENLVCRLL